MKVQLKWNQDKMDELSHRLEKILFQRQESGILHNTALWSDVYKRQDCKIIVAMHKSCEVPVDPMYFPLQVGAAGKDVLIPLNRKEPVARDDTGDNISEKNPSYCELTGLYWAWKNLQAEVIGLVHYRRYFERQDFSDGLYHLPIDDILSEAEAEELMERYDIVVPKRQKYYIETLYSHYAHTHYREHLDVTREIIREQCPQYLDSVSYTHLTRGVAAAHGDGYAGACAGADHAAESRENRGNRHAQGEGGYLIAVSRLPDKVDIRHIVQYHDQNGQHGGNTHLCHQSPYGFRGEDFLRKFVLF